MSEQTRFVVYTFLGTTTVGVQLEVVHPQLHPLLIAGILQQEAFHEAPLDWAWATAAKEARAIV